jgi:hypothetical protein
MALTGRPDAAPLVASEGVIERISALGRHLDVDALALLGERAAIEGLTRHGPRSCGGSARLVRAADDDWIVVQLARPEDHDSVAAWLELDGPPPEAEVWATIERCVAGRDARDLIDRAALRGLPFTRVGEVPPPVHDPSMPVPASARAVTAGPATPTPAPTSEPNVPAAAVDGLLVVDLSSLWAGPLAARLLADRGARVVKVESTSRPDGARRGPAAFYDRFHHGTRSVALDLTHPDGQARLRELVARADVVIEGSRPRALRRMGIDADDVLSTGPVRVWLSITGFGRAVDRVAFGDGAAAAGGLVAVDDGGPCFVADAVADPLAGLVGATAVDAALAAGGRWAVDVSMAGVAAHVAGPAPGERWRPDPSRHPAPPSAPVAPEPAPALGAHNAEVGAELEIDLGGDWG